MRSGRIESGWRRLAEDPATGPIAARPSLRPVRAARGAGRSGFYPRGRDATIDGSRVKFATSPWAFQRPGSQPVARAASVALRRKESASVFTGLVEVLGRVERVVEEKPGRRLPCAGRAWPRPPGDRRERGGQRLLPDGRRRRGRAVRGPGGAGDACSARTWATAAGDRSTSSGRSASATGWGATSSRGTSTPRRPSASAGSEGEWEFLAFDDRPGLDPADGPQGLDRRRRREPDPGRRLARRASRSCSSPTPWPSPPWACSGRATG